MLPAVNLHCPMKTTDTLKDKATPLRLSPYLDLTPLKAGGGSLFNLMTGRRYELGSQALAVLRYFAIPRLPEEASERFPSAEEEQVLTWLHRNRLLVEDTPDGWQDFTTDMIAAKDRLFGMAAYHPQAEVVLLGVPFGKGNGRSLGGAEFPFRLREFGQKNGLNLTHSDLPFLNPSAAARLRPLLGEKRVVDAGNLFVSHNESTAFLYEKMYRVARGLFQRNHRPLFIGGDHSISYPLIRAAAERHPGLHILHFDAHTDTYSSRFDVVRHPGTVHHYGNFMTHCLGLETVGGVWQIGIRGLTNAFATENPRQRIVWAQEVIRRLAEAEPWDLPRGVPWYVTFDVDVLDPAELPGTATPVPGGLTVREIDRLLEQLLPGLNLVGMDVVEANPDFDATDRTTQLTAELILKLLSYFSS